MHLLLLLVSMYYTFIKALVELVPQGASAVVMLSPLSLCGITKEERILMHDEFSNEDMGDCGHFIPEEERDGEGYACTLSHSWASAQRVACEDFKEQA